MGLQCLKKHSNYTQIRQEEQRVVETAKGRENSSNQIMFGQVEKAEVWKPKYGNGSTESEVRSEKKSSLSVFSAFLSHECVC